MESQDLPLRTTPIVDRRGTGAVPLTGITTLGIVHSTIRHTCGFSRIAVEERVVSKELVAASTRPLVLCVLSGGENYGYAIIQRVRELSEGELEWSEGMLYPVLHRLEREKLVVSRWNVAENGRKRKYYRLSAAGTRFMKAERRQWFTVHNTLAKLWGADRCPT